MLAHRKIWVVGLDIRSFCSYPYAGNFLKEKNILTQGLADNIKKRWMQLRAIHAMHVNHATNRCNNQTNNIERKCDNLCRLRSPLKMNTGFNAPTQMHMSLHIVLLQLHCNNYTANIVLQQLNCNNCSATMTLQQCSATIALLQLLYNNFTAAIALHNALHFALQIYS